MTILGIAGEKLDVDVRDLDVPAMKGAAALLLPAVLIATQSAREFRQVAADENATPDPSREFRRTERLIIRVPAYASGTPLPVHARQMVPGTAPRIATTLDGPLQTALERLADERLQSLPPRASLALLVAGRYRTVSSWVAGCAVLGIASVLSLGPSGLMSWWQTLRLAQSVATNADFTLAHFFGFEPVTYALWLLEGSAALLLAWRRKAETDMVFAAGILGTAAVAFHFHDYDYSILILAAWLVLRTSPPMWHRRWLLLGIVSVQVTSLAPDDVQPIVDFATHAPRLIWGAAWLGILLIGTYPASRVWLKRPDAHSRRTALHAPESGEARLLG